MKILIKYISFFFILILFSHFSFSQSIQTPYIEAESTYIGEDSLITGATRSIPPHYFKRLDGYKFEILMHIKMPDNAIFEYEALDIVYVLPDGTANKLSISQNKVIRISSQEYEYSFQIKLKYNDWVEIFLTERNDFLKTTDARFYNNISNKIKIYLAHI